MEITQEPRAVASTGMSLSQKMAMWGLDPTRGDMSLTDHSLPDSSEREDDDLNTAVLLEYSDLRNFLLEGDEYAWLTRQFQNCLGSNNFSGNWLQSRDLLTRSIDRLSNRPSNKYSLTICLPWQPAKFLQQQYAHMEDLPTLNSVITISGEVKNAYVTSCEEYVSHTWPQYGPLILTSLQHAATSRQRLWDYVTGNLIMKVTFTDDSTTLNLSGPPLFLIDAVEVSLWLSVACRASETSDMMSTGCTVLEKVDSGHHDLGFKVKHSLRTIRADSDVSGATCWHHLFRNPVIAEGYPIPLRTENEEGLELSVDAIVTLACTSFAVNYAGYLLLKGFNSMLAPTKRVGSSVTWHFLVSEKDKRQSYNDGLKYSRIRNFDDAIFDGARHFVGWSKDVKFLVGESC